MPTDDPDRFSTLTYTFGDQGRYQLSEQDGFIDITVVKAPVDYLAPLFVLLAVLFFLVFISFVGPPGLQLCNRQVGAKAIAIDANSICSINFDDTTNQLHNQDGS